MSQLADLLNKNDKNKGSIGYAGLTGYDTALSTLDDDLSRVLHMSAFKTSTQKTKGTSGTAFADNLSLEVDADNFTIDTELKQVILTAKPSYTVPLKFDKDGNTAYTYAANNAADSNEKAGVLHGKYVGIPSWQTPQVLNAINSASNGASLKMGVGIDLENIGPKYMKTFWARSDFTPTDFSSLVQKGLICAEIVMHSSSELQTSGTVFYANIVDSKSDTVTGTSYNMRISPMFLLLSQFSSVNFALDCADNESSFALKSSNKYTIADNYTYDYKTGDITGLTYTELNKYFTTAQIESTLSFCSQTYNKCRVRLFIPEDRMAMATQTVNKEFPKDFSKVNTKIEYTGGQEITTINSSMTGAAYDNDVVAMGMKIMQFMTDHEFLYGLDYKITGGGNQHEVTTAASAPCGLAADLQSAGLKYCPNAKYTYTIKDSNGNSSQVTRCICDCSLFVSWVLRECGIMRAASGSGGFKDGSAPMASGYSLQEISQPEEGAIAWRSSHVGLAISKTQVLSYGSSNWMTSGKSDKSGNNETLSKYANSSWSDYKEKPKFNQPQSLPGTYQKYFRIVNNSNQKK